MFYALFVIREFNFIEGTHQLHISSLATAVADRALGISHNSLTKKKTALLL